MPETLKGLWNQRLRWAQGGSEVLLRYLGHMFNWRARRMWGVYFEYFTSIVWSYTMLLVFLMWIWGLFFTVALRPAASQSYSGMVRGGVEYDLPVAVCRGDAARLALRARPRAVATM